MTDKLTLYNLTLGHLRERRLGSLSENREPRRALDDFYDQVVQECLEEGYWNFMIRSVQADHSETLTPGFGWAYAFPLPNDWVRVVIVSADESFTIPLMEYVEEAGYLYANVTPLFYRYISKDPQYGKNLGTWTGNFTGFVALKLAEYACGRVTGSDKLLDGPNGISSRCRKAKVKAKSVDAMNEPPGRMPFSSWVTSRGGFGPRTRGTGNDD